MRILISSHRYAPDVGGIETTSARLAEAWSRNGHEVALVTQTPGGGAAGGFPVHRRPSRRELFRLAQACDVYWHNNVSLQTAWPVALLRRPWVVTTQCWLQGVDGKPGWNDHLKRAALRHAENVYISRAIARHVGQPGRVIPNPYDASVFRRLPGTPRDHELVFLGRLVSDKGASLLLQALTLLAPRLRPRLTIIGGGPEEGALRAQAEAGGLNAQVDFAGWLSGAKLAERLNRHRVMVVPSVWEEPFGIVALEGLACGCRVVASASGGLPDAVGPGGALFAPGDAASLAAAIARTLAEPEETAEAGAAIARHLSEHSADAIASRYLELFKALVEGGR